MKKYDKYKDSGIEWLGDIPVDWELITFSRICQLQQGLQIPISARLYEQKEGCLEYITTKSVHNPEQQRQYVLNPKESVTCNKNEVLLGRTGNTGEVVTNVEGVFHNNFFKIDFNSNAVYKQFLVFYLNNVHIQEAILLAAGTTTIPDLNHGDFLCLPLGLPSLSEQTTIAKYLDYKTTQIDALIEKKEQLIEKLKLQRQAIINELVTGKKVWNGTSWAAPRKVKDSGIEWLGEIPEEWERLKLGRSFSNIASGTTPKSTNSKYYQDGTINWLNTGDLNDSFIEETSKKITQLAIEKFSTLKVYPIGSIVIALYGATIGKLGHLKIETTTNQACCVISHSELIDQRFLFYYFLAAREFIISKSYGGGQPNISQELIRQLYIPTPSLCQQTTITQFLDNKTTQIDVLIAKDEQFIEKLKLYRQSLISEAVTGKIDLRDWDYDSAQAPNKTNNN